jgi:cell division protein FtsQ
MTETSLVPELAAHGGLTFEEPVAMDDRGRLAQSLKLKLKRRATAARRLRVHAWSASNSRVFRLARRWGCALLALKVPRGAGASAAAMLLLGSTYYGVVKGGHAPAIAAQVQDICDTAANGAGFRISEIALAGEHEVSREDILNLAGVTGRSSLLFLDAAQTRLRLLTNPWIAQAAVLKLYPGRLGIEIKERKAFALWQKEGRVYLIAADGTVLETYVPRRFASLPLVVGHGAEHTAQDFLDLLKRYPVIAKSVEASVLVAERRWNLHLKSGVEVLLPEREPEHALRMLVDLALTKKLLARDIVAVDLRLGNRITVRQSDAAAAAREEALKAAEKDKKAKRKGSDA